MTGAADAPKATPPTDEPSKEPTKHEKRLSGFRARIERMIRSPKDVGGRISRLLAPIFRAFGWQARFESKALKAMLGTVRVSGEVPDAELAKAIAELANNIDVAERCVTVTHRVPTAHASWLMRVLELLTRIAALSATKAPEPNDSQLGTESNTVSSASHTADAALVRSRSGVGLLASIDVTRVMPPLRLDLSERPQDPLEERSKDAPKPPVDARLAAAKALAADPAKARLLELELAAIDQISEAARSETQFLERRRRLFEGARRLLLDAAAALPLDPEGLRAREQSLADQISLVNRAVGAGLDPNVALGFQAKRAHQRGEAERLYAALAAMDSFGRAVGDTHLSAAAGRAMSGVESLGLPRTDGDASEHRASNPSEMSRSAREVFGDRIVDEIARRYDDARRAKAAEPPVQGGDEVDAEVRQLALTYLAPGAEQAALSALLTVDGSFEVGGALSPVRSFETEKWARLVSHPTREIVLTPARSVEDIPNAVIGDPRMILLDLAAGRLLARRYIERGETVRERIELTGEVRVYVLDGSTSMLNLGIEMARARMRDAILVGELATMLKRLEAPGRNTRVALYYRYFTKRMGDLQAVRTGREAIAALGDVIGKARSGGTDIQQALVSSFDLIRAERQKDPHLAKASIVLITDGAAPVDPDLLRVARERSGVPIRVSVIALGEENPVLRDLVARQRAAGEEAFYHFLDDARLAALCRGESIRERLHLTSEARDSLTEVDRASLGTAISDALQEISDIDQLRHTGKAGPAAPGPEAARAHDEAVHRDRRALDRRYARWFPNVEGEDPNASAAAIGASGVNADAPLSSDEDAVLVLLATISECVGELGGDALHRQADAIETAERLLVDASLMPDRYLELVQSPHPRIRAALKAVTTAVRQDEAAAFEARLSSTPSGRNAGRGRPITGAARAARRA